MSLLPGFEDMHAKKVLGVDAHGRLQVDHGEQAGIKLYDLYVTAQGSLKAQPHVPKVDTSGGIDQIGVPESVPVSKRWIGVDQG